MSEDYRPRAHDHRIEPVFGGLGVGAAPPERRGWLARLSGLVRRLGRALLRLVRPSTPAGGR